MLLRGVTVPANHTVQDFLLFKTTPAVATTLSYIFNISQRKLCPRLPRPIRPAAGCFLLGDAFHATSGNSDRSDGPVGGSLWVSAMRGRV